MSKNHLLLPLFFLLSCTNNTKQLAKNKDTFLTEQLVMAKPIWKYIKSNSYTLNKLQQNDFTKKIDSIQSIFTMHLNHNKTDLDTVFYKQETIGIQLAFDKLLLEYPKLHKRYTGNSVSLSKNNTLRLKNNLKFFNQEELLELRDVREYIDTYIKIEATKNLKTNVHNNTSNQELHANWNVLEMLFTNPKCSDFWKHKILSYHIDNFGIKNVENIYSNYATNCTTPKLLNSIQNLYKTHKDARDSHLIETYKKIDNFKLDMHLFFPNSNKFKGKRPTIIQFHGGSWSQGKPDWYFSTAKEYAKKGWVVGVVEYRTKGKHGSYPFESVKDAKSAIRWLKENAQKFNIDPQKIIATGNSAGGHLALAISLIDNWNESTDNLKTNPKPFAIIVNAGVYDLTNKENSWITEHLKNKALVNEISPNFLHKKTTVKMLLIHGDQDKNCPYTTASSFYNTMKTLGNDIELQTITGADHWIWYGKHASQVSKITNQFLKKLGL